MTGLAIEDQFAVRATLARYCHRCDDGDLTGVVALFTADGVLIHGDRTARGTAELLEFFQSTQSRPSQRGKHVTVNAVLEHGGRGLVRVVADFVFLRFAGDRLVPAITGRYHDEIVRVDGAWRFARREVHTLEKPG
ncbi:MULTISPECIES: nuclear transport factor 2 family protein [unclassified Pseudofrankia]|uniref:nuclear transport factor 2 family protein n=1 Tax=unclassified Pseudofrankia TaxID=2994372 RepID=UPI0008D95C51|nr:MULTISPECIES: nuclear transport factor 2 family protein [unclassified Pseudofrankia]MDT3443200.1 nuclear transport factor 2 family protein [Pseudofrankia sp. BMG5.37]OHV58963.1 DUF4440 domain-containing protein [Pseudofrankia sp. BMG5.36]